MKSMKFLLAAVMLSVCSVSMAQKPGENGGHCPMNPEKAMEMRWQKVAKKLMLSDKQAEKVKVIYTDYMKEMMALNPMPTGKPECGTDCKKGEGKQGDCKKAEGKPGDCCKKAEGKKEEGKPDDCCKKGEGKKEMTEAEVTQNMKQKFANQRKRIDIQEKYFEKFSKELNPRQAKYLVNSCKMPKPGKMNKGGKGMKRGHQFNMQGQCPKAGQPGMRGNHCGMTAPKDSIR